MKWPAVNIKGGESFFAQFFVEIGFEDPRKYLKSTEMIFFMSLSESRFWRITKLTFYYGGEAMESKCISSPQSSPYFFHIFPRISVFKYFPIFLPWNQNAFFSPQPSTIFLSEAVADRCKCYYIPKSLLNIFSLFLLLYIIEKDAWRDFFPAHWKLLLCFVNPYYPI